MTPYPKFVAGDICVIHYLDTRLLICRDTDTAAELINTTCRIELGPDGYWKRYVVSIIDVNPDLKHPSSAPLKQGLYLSLTEVMLKHASESSLLLKEIDNKILWL